MVEDSMRAEVLRSKQSREQWSPDMWKEYNDAMARRARGERPGE